MGIPNHEGHMLTCICGKSYWPNQAWLHKSCSINTADVPINTDPTEPINAPDAPINADKSANGRSRSDYNDYMRSYMKRYRANKKGAVKPI